MVAAPMLNFREFEAGPDPFGRKYQVFLKWLQTAISTRHSDTVDVKFTLVDDNGEHTEKTIALPHADLLRVSGELGRSMDDPWCTRIAAHHLLYLVETGEDMEKDIVTVPLTDVKRYATEIARVQTSEVGAK
jgi:hypothetical protein